MRNPLHAIEKLDPQPLVVDAPPLAHMSLLARPPRDGRDIMLLVADEPLSGLLLELAHLNGYDAFACQTPLDAIATLVEVGERIACAFVCSSIGWADALAEFLEDEYPHIERVVIS